MSGGTREVADSWEDEDATPLTEQMRKALRERELKKQNELKIAQMTLAQSCKVETVSATPDSDSSSGDDSDAEQTVHQTIKVMQRQTNDDDKTKMLSVAEEELRREQLRAGRAAAYLQARERIFGGDAPGETAAADTSGESLRTSRSANSLAADTEQPAAVESTSRSSVSSSSGTTMVVRTADNQPITVQRASAAVRAQLPSANPPGRGRVCPVHSAYAHIRAQMRTPVGRTGPTHGYRAQQPPSLIQPYMFPSPQQPVQQPPVAAPWPYVVPPPPVNNGYYNQYDQQQQQVHLINAMPYGCPPVHLHHVASAPAMTNNAYDFPPLQSTVQPHYNQPPPSHTTYMGGSHMNK